MIKKLFMALGLAFLPQAAHAFFPIEYVQVSSMTPITQQLGGFNVSTGAVGGLTGSTVTFSSATFSSATINAATLTNSITANGTTGTSGQMLISGGAAPPFWASARVLQTCFSTLLVASATTTSTFANTGLKCTITPSVATSSMVIIASGNLRDSAEQTQQSAASIARDAVNLGNATLGLCYQINGGTAITNEDLPCTMVWVDGPGLTGPHTYNVTISAGAGGVTTTWNAQGGTSEILVMEIGP
jgi:hypothetical protein